MSEINLFTLQDQIRLNPNRNPCPFAEANACSSRFVNTWICERHLVNVFHLFKKTVSAVNLLGETSSPSYLVKTSSSVGVLPMPFDVVPNSSPSRLCINRQALLSAVSEVVSQLTDASPQERLLIGSVLPGLLTNDLQQQQQHCLGGYSVLAHNPAVREYLQARWGDTLIQAFSPATNSRYLFRMTDLPTFYQLILLNAEPNTYRTGDRVRVNGAECWWNLDTHMIRVTDREIFYRARLEDNELFTPIVFLGYGTNAGGDEDDRFRRVFIPNRFNMIDTTRQSMPYCDIR